MTSIEKTGFTGLLAALLLVLPNLLIAQEASPTDSSCKRWVGMVDPGGMPKARLTDSSLSKARPGIPVRIVTWNDSSLTDQEVLQAIRCLLTCKGNTHPARISGATRVEVSAQLPHATVEIAALYYISALFLQNYSHADGIALRGNGRVNPAGSVDAAYAAYGRWFEVVKTIGLQKARTQHLNPLEGTGLHWY